MATTQYFKVLQGINYPPGNQRAEAGDVIDNFPNDSVKDHLKLKVIEKASKKDFDDFKAAAKAPSKVVS